MLQRLVQLTEPEHESTDGIRFRHPLGTLPLQLLDPDLRILVAFHQPVVPGKVIALIQRRGAVLIDAALGQLGHHFQLLKKQLHLPVDVGAIRQLRLYHSAILNQEIPIRQELVIRFEELGLDEVFRQVRGAAFAFTLELVIALPDHPAVFVRAVPGLRAKVVAAVAADQAAGKNGFAAVAPAQRLSPGHLFLHPVEQERVDDCFVTVLHIVLRDLALVDFHFLLQEIDRELLLAEMEGFEPPRRFSTPTSRFSRLFG